MQLDPSLAKAVADVIREQVDSLRSSFEIERKALESRIADLQAQLSIPVATARQMDDVTTRLSLLEAREPVQGERGERGIDGISGQDGRDGIDGKDGIAGDRGADGQDGAPGRDGIDGKDGRDGIDGKNGNDGIHGRDGAPGLPGKDGRDGIDGKSITVDDIRSVLDAAYARWALDAERRSMDVIQRAIDRMPLPKDGADGKNGIDGKDGADGAYGKDGRDGLDGLGFDDMDFFYDGERTFRLKFVRGDQVKEFSAKIPCMLYRGVFKITNEYEIGDCVTWGGSVWIAQKDKPGKPAEGDGWKLAVKSGRDGKDGSKGERGEPGPTGRNGRDLTTLMPDGSRF